MKTVLRAAGLAAIITACDAVGPGTLCGCSPPLYSAIVAGTVLDGNGAPAASARVNAQFRSAARCSDNPGTPSTFVRRIDADGAGRFADTLSEGWLGTTCWGFSASPLGPPWTESDTQLVTIRFRGWGDRDSVNVVLRLR